MALGTFCNTKWEESGRDTNVCWTSLCGAAMLRVRRLSCGPLRSPRGRLRRVGNLTVDSHQPSGLQRVPLAPGHPRGSTELMRGCGQEMGTALGRRRANAQEDALPRTPGESRCCGVSLSWHMCATAQRERDWSVGDKGARSLRGRYYWFSRVDSAISPCYELVTEAREGLWHLLGIIGDCGDTAFECKVGFALPEFNHIPKYAMLMFCGSPVPPL